jgi:CubicO group peptidase (beta-lactamase class C family)
MDRRQWLQSAAVAASVLGAGAAAGETAPVRAKVLSAGRSGTDYGPALEKLAAYAELHRREFGLPGMTLAFADEDGFRAVLTLGLADVDRKEPVGPDHLFQIGSISKSFIAMSILKLVEEGKINLDAAVADLLPELPLSKAPRFTVRQLLNHTSGLPDFAPLFPRGQDGLWCGFAPGTHTSYSNTGYEILGRLIAQADGRPFSESVRERVLKPLGMAATHPLIRDSDRALYATGYSPLYRDRPYIRRDPLASGPWTPMTNAAGSIASTPADMSRYLAFIISAGQGRGAPVLSDASARTLLTPTNDGTVGAVFGPGSKYACGLGLFPYKGRILIHHTGGMILFSSSFHVDAAAGVGAFASTNCRVSEGYRPRLITAYGCELMAAVRAGQPLPAPPELPHMAAADPKDATPAPLVSKSGEALAIEIVSGALVLRWNGEAVELERSGEDAFLVRHPRFQLLPLKLKRKDGKVTSAFWGNEVFAADPAEREPAPVPDALKAFAGRYDNNDPWTPGLTRVIARADGLFIDGVEPLIALPDGSYRAGEAPEGCERARFDGPLNGKLQRLTLSGIDTVRTGEALDG